jgi:hypothetical protein
LAPSRLTLLIEALWQRGHAVRWIHHPRLLSPDQLALQRHMLVAHGSALPQGQGWSPMTWQILDGASRHHRSPSRIALG